MLDERSGVSYPNGVQDKNGLIWITYDRDRGGAGEILLGKFKEEDVAAGKNASGLVSLRQAVNKPTIKVTRVFAKTMCRPASSSAKTPR